MYGEVPLILQGAAQRETLSPDQLHRLAASGVPVDTQKASVNVSSVLPMLVIGAVAAFFLVGGSGRRMAWLFLLAVLTACSTDRPPADTASVAPARALFHAAAFTGTSTDPLPGLENAPIVYRAQPPLTNITATVAFDSLRVIVEWSHPTDGLGEEDSTVFNIKASKAIRFSGGGSVAPNTYRRRKHLASRTADTFRVTMPALGDSVIWQADSIRQCRQGACSVPGSAAWGYLRSAAPPSMTFIRVITDSF